MADILSFLSNPVGSVVSGIGQIIGANQTNKANLRAVREQNEANYRLAELQYKRNLDLWRKQNVYNSPQAQIQRLTDAGLNPQLMYGNGSTSTGNASTPPQYEAPNIMRYQTQDATGIGQASQSVGSGIAQLGQLQLLSEQIRNQSLRNQKLGIDLAYYDNTLSLKQQTLSEKLGVARYDAMVAQEMSNHVKEIVQSDVERKVKLNLLTDSNINLNNAQINRISYDIGLIISNIDLNKARKGEAEARTELLKHQAEIERVLAQEGLNLRDSTDRVINGIIELIKSMPSDLMSDDHWYGGILRGFYNAAGHMTKIRR